MADESGTDQGHQKLFLVCASSSCCSGGWIQASAVPVSFSELRYRNSQKETYTEKTENLNTAHNAVTTWGPEGLRAAMVPLSGT